MRKLALILGIFLCSNVFGDIPSQKDALNKQYIAAKNKYTQAVRSNDSSLFAEAVEDYKSLGQAIIAANKPLTQWMGTYFSDATQGFHKNDIDMKSALKDIQNANKNITLFSSPKGMTPEAIRSVDAFITLLNKSITVHDAACQKINMAHTTSTGQQTKARIN